MFYYVTPHNSESQEGVGERGRETGKEGRTMMKTTRETDEEEKGGERERTTRMTAK